MTIAWMEGRSSWTRKGQYPFAQENSTTIVRCRALATSHISNNFARINITVFVCHCPYAIAIVPLTYTHAFKLNCDRNCKCDTNTHVSGWKEILECSISLGVSLLFLSDVERQAPTVTSPFGIVTVPAPSNCPSRKFPGTSIFMTQKIRHDHQRPSKPSSALPAADGVTYLNTRLQSPPLCICPARPD